MKMTPAPHQPFCLFMKRLKIQEVTFTFLEWPEVMLGQPLLIPQRKQRLPTEFGINDWRSLIAWPCTVIIQDCVDLHRVIT